MAADNPTLVMLGALIEIGEYAVEPGADPMKAVIEIQAIAERARIAAGGQPDKPVEQLTAR